MKFRAGPLALVIVLLSVAPLARAQDAAATATTAGPDADLAAIREMILYARYTTAEPAIATYLARTDLTATQRNAGLEARAILLIARRRLPDARTTLAELYARDPDHTIRDPDAGPDVRNEFDRARAAHPAHVAITMEDRTPHEMTERSSPTLAIHLTAGADAVNELRLWWRNGETGTFQQTIMSLDAATAIASARIPVADGVDAYAAQYYVDAMAPSGAALDRLGSPETPLTVSVPHAPDVAHVDPERIYVTTDGAPVHQSSVFEEWWFWTIVGVVVVGAGVGLYFGITSATGSGNGPMPGTLGEGHL
jgi:hypothetical protein